MPSDPPDSLADLILAARVAGDPDTADWLASIADDPEQVAAVLAAAAEDPPAPEGRPKA